MLTASYTDRNGKKSDLWGETIEAVYHQLCEVDPRPYTNVARVVDAQGKPAGQVQVFNSRPRWTHGSATIY